MSNLLFDNQENSGFAAIKVAFAGAVIAAVSYYHRRRILATLIEYGGETIDQSTRRNFRTCVLNEGYYSDTHLHGMEASERHESHSTISDFILRNGYTERPYQRSKKDAEANPNAGTREPYLTRDLDIPMRAGGVFGSPTEITTIFDVDYYMDGLPSILGYNPHSTPLVLYSFVPVSAAGVSGATSWHFESNQDLEVIVTGNAVYRHQLWDFSVDTVFAWSWGIGDNWLPYVRAQQYSLERVRASDHHSIIGLFPVWRSTNLLGMLACLLEGKQLKRFTPVKGEIVAYDVKSQKTHVRTMAHVGDFVSASIPRQVMDIVKRAQAQAKTSWGISSIQNSLRHAYAGLGIGVEDAELYAQAVLLLDLGMESYVPYTVVPMRNAVRKIGVRPIPGEDVEDAKPMMTPFMSPFVHQAYSHLKTAAAGAQAVRSRVLDLVMVDPGPLKQSTEMYMDEFAEFLFPVAGILGPVSIDEVRERQKRPTQSRLLDKAEDCDTTPGRSSFIPKGEAYPQLKDGRVITIIEPGAKLAYGQFIYPYTDVVSLNEFYAFGRAPSEISARCTEIAARSVSLTMADAARMDGRIGERVRLLEKKCKHRAFHPAHHAELDRCIEANHHNISVMIKNGTYIKYLAQFERGSGSMETAVDNTLLSVFICYNAKRKEGMSPRSAWNWVTQNLIAGGDDVLCSGILEDSYTASAVEVGMLMTYDHSVPGQSYNFLNRIFYDWTGTNNGSRVNVDRMMKKFHVLSRGFLNELEPLMVRYVAIRDNDSTTPILKEIMETLEHVIRLAPIGTIPNTDKLALYLPYMTGWPCLSCPEHIAEAYYELADYDFETLLLWKTRVTRCTTYTEALETFKNAPLLLEPVPVGLGNNEEKQEEEEDEGTTKLLKPVALKNGTTLVPKGKEEANEPSEKPSMKSKPPPKAKQGKDIGASTPAKKPQQKKRRKKSGKKAAPKKGSKGGPK